MEKKKMFWPWVVSVIAIFILLIWVINLNGQLQAAQTDLANVQNLTEANSINQKFLDKFFNYQSTQQRYEGIKPLTTDQGYKATFPSGKEPPKSNQTVNSTLQGLKTYDYRKSKTEIEFLNEFQLTTEFKGDKNTQSVIVHTVVSYGLITGWKISDVEFVAQFTGGQTSPK
jgi:hypothetical protein